MHALRARRSLPVYTAARIGLSYKPLLRCLEWQRAGFDRSSEGVAGSRVSEGHHRHRNLQLSCQSGSLRAPV